MTKWRGGRRKQSDPVSGGDKLNSNTGRDDGVTPERNFDLPSNWNPKSSRTNETGEGKNSRENNAKFK